MQNRVVRLHQILWGTVPWDVTLNRCPNLNLDVVVSEIPPRQDKKLHRCKPRLR